MPALHFLLVGPREEDYFVIRDSLRKAKLDHVHSLEDVKQCLHNSSYDLVLLQCEAGEDLAIAVVRELDTLSQKVPFLYLTDCSEEPVATLMEVVGGDCVQRSNLRQESLLRAIRNAISIHRAEQESRAAQEMLRKLSPAVEQSADIVVITNRAGVIQYVNPAFEKLTGYSPEEAVGQTPRILKSGEQTPEEYRRLWTTVLAGEVYRGTIINRKKNGEFYVAEKTVTPVRNGEGEITHFTSNDPDITDRRRLETALFQAQKMDAIGQLAGGVAHDFNNLLLVISSYAELMLDTIGPEHHLHRHVEEILGATRRAADLRRYVRQSAVEESWRSPEEHC
jgi:PAS domain S-box-containing protein